MFQLRLFETEKNKTNVSYFSIIFYFLSIFLVATRRKTHF